MSVLLISLLIVFIIVGAGFALLRGLYRTLARIGSGICGVVAAFFATKLLTPVFSSPIIKIASSLLLSKFRISTGEIEEPFPNTYRFIEGVLQAAISLPLFMILLILFFAIFFLISLIFEDMLPSCEQCSKLLLIPSSLLGAVSGLLAFIILLVPFANFAIITSTSTDYIADILESDTVSQTSNSISENWFIRTASTTALSSPIEYLTSYGSSGKSNLKDDVVLAVRLGYIIYKFSQKPIKELDNDEINKITDAIDSLPYSESFVMIYSELVSVIGTQLLSDDALAAEFFSDTDIFSTPAGDNLLNDVLTVLADTDPATAQDDIRTVSEVISAILFSEALRDEETSDDVAMIFISDEKTGTKVLTAIIENNRLSSLLSSVAAYGVTLLGDTLDIDSETINTAVNSIRNNVSSNKNNTPEEEAELLAVSMSTIVSIMNDNDSGDELRFGKETVEKIGTLLTSLSKTDIIPNDALSGIATSAVDTINDSLPDLDLSSLSRLVNSSISGEGDTNIQQLMGTISSGIAISDSFTNETKVEDSDIEVLIRDLNTETASSVSDIFSSDYFEKLGVPQENSDSCHNMISTLLVNIANEDVNDENLSTETAAISHAIDMVSLLSSSDTSSFLTSAEEADDFITTCIDSVIFTATINDICTNDQDNKIADPLGLSSKLSSDAANNLRNSLTVKYNSGTADIKAVCVNIALILLGNNPF